MSYKERLTQLQKQRNAASKTYEARQKEKGIIRQLIPMPAYFSAALRGHATQHGTTIYQALLAVISYHGGRRQVSESSMAAMVKTAGKREKHTKPVI